jgi:hypothetical protein
MIEMQRFDLLYRRHGNQTSYPKDNIQLLDEAEQNIVIYQWRADQLFADTS